MVDFRKLWDSQSYTYESTNKGAKTSDQGFDYVILFLRKGRRKVWKNHSGSNNKSVLLCAYKLVE